MNSQHPEDKTKRKLEKKHLPGLAALPKPKLLVVVVEVVGRPNPEGGKMEKELVAA